jgi:hypothetical protein
VAAVALALGLSSAASARVASEPWPPAKGQGLLFAHFGEEHINDEDGPTLLPKVVEEVARYRPDLVTTSGDKADDGEAEQFRLWRAALKGLDDAKVPYYAAAGNHDRDAPPGVPGGTIGLFFLTTPESFDPYKEAFADKPYPWGDGAPYADERIGPRARAEGDPAGAAATYYVDIGNVRWVFVDNSCWSITGCEPFQARADGSSGSQFDYLRQKASEATRAGKVVFVLMHLPTRDPRDQSYTDTTATNHVMSKGFTQDNDTFEQAARDTGVDGVFVAHIKGQFLYRSLGVPYFIDGGAGGELYTTGPVGVDHGYWHGYRLIRVAGEAIGTDAVPIFVPNGIRVEGPDTVQPSQEAAFSAFGKQPVFKDTAKVEALELRDPDPKAPSSGGFVAGFPDVVKLIPFLPLLLALLLAPALTWLGKASRPRRRLAGVAAATGALAVVAVGAVAVAQQSIPTRTGKSALPAPARMWTSSNPAVLAPKASDQDDPRRDARTQTKDGRFAGVCPGRAVISVTSGWEQQDRTVRVASRPGRIVASVRSAKAARRGRRVVAASVRLAQPAVVRIRVLSGKKVVARRASACVRRSASLRFIPRAAGRYTVETRVSSDRRPVVSRSSLRVR